MNLKILEPFRIFEQKSAVRRIVAETNDGYYGFLPHRRDCVTALTPGILVYDSEDDGEVFVAVDQGILVKTGLDVSVSVRKAVAGKDLGQLRELVMREFLTLDAQEQGARSAMAKLETGFLRRFANFKHE